MLEKEIDGVYKYIKEYTKLKGSFNIDNKDLEKKVWLILNDNKYEPIFQKIIKPYENINKFLSFFNKEKTVPLTSKDLIILISKYQLRNVLIIFINLSLNYSKVIAYDFLVDTFIKDKYYEGIRLFNSLYFTPNKISWSEKMIYNFKDTSKKIVKTLDEDLILNTIRYELYDNLTDLVNLIINLNQLSLALTILEKNYELINFKIIGKNILKLNNETLLLNIMKYLDQSDKNYLLSQVGEYNLNMGIILIKNGANINETYYNSNTFSNINKILKILTEEKES